MQSPQIPSPLIDIKFLGVIINTTDNFEGDVVEPA